MANKNTALAPAGSFQLVKRFDSMDPDLLAELQDELDDLDPENGINCLQIKIPSGGGTAYAVLDADGDEEPMKQITAVLIFTHRANGYWPGAYGSGDDTNKLPACSSMDGKNAIWTDTNEPRSCETCQMNQYNTATDQAGRTTKGKACKNMRRLYLMMSGDPNLYLLTVPPTSIKDVNKQLAKIIANGTPYTGITVNLTLEKAKNANGVSYSKVVIKPAGTLPPDVAAQATALRRQIKEQYKSVALTLDDYAPAQDQPRAARSGGVDVPPMSDEEWASLTGEDPGPVGAAFEDAPATGNDPDLPFA